MPRGHIIGVQQFLDLGPSAEDSITGVAGILQDRRDSRSLPAIARATPILLGPMRLGNGIGGFSYFKRATSKYDCTHSSLSPLSQLQ